jgi:hypothetical protein
MTLQQTDSKNLSVPVLTGAFLTLFLAGCGAGSDALNTPPADSSSSSAPAMMQQDSSSSDGAMMQTSSSDSSAMQQSSSAAALSDTYTDGMYSAEGTYRSPAGMETVHVALTIKDDTVTAATFTGDATNPKSKVMQGNFAAGFKELVIGKPIDSLSLGVVNGSSLTGGGFMDAVAKIKAEAKA